MNKFNFKAVLSILLVSIFPLSIFTPVFSASQIELHSDLKIRNMTTGEDYKDNLSAKVDDQLMVQVWYHNPQPPDSGNNATNVNVKISTPTNFGKTHTFNSSVGGSNTNAVSDSSVVTTAIDTSVEFIPGTAYRRFNKGTNESPNWVTEKISDSVTTTGYQIPTMKPCYNFQETITIQVRVKTPVVSIKKEVRKEGDKDYKTEITVNPGDKLNYIITFKNEGNVKLNDVIIRDSFPPGLIYTKGSAKLYNGQFPNGTTISDNLINGGVNVGNYLPGVTGYVRFNAELPKVMKPGCHKYTNIGVVKSKELGEFYNTAIVNVCVKEEVKPPTPVTPSEKPPVTPPEITPTSPTPTALPVTGAEQAVLGTLGSISLAGAGLYYRKGRKTLKNAFRLLK